VIGYTEIVLADMPRDDMAHFNLEQVLKAGFRAKDLVKQILTFSRQADQEIKPVQVRQVTQEALTLLRASLPSTIEFRHDLKSNANVLADPIQIHQIVMNLGTNAAHAMEETGGVLDVRLTNICLPLLWAKNLGVKPGDHIELKVIDTGQGISPETCERIFDPFFTTKEKGRGTGMGLSVVHGILKNCGGAVTVESTVGKGSTFTVFFPVLHMSRPPTHQKERVLRRGQERILFVDDEPFQSDMTGQILRRLGYDVIAFTDSVASLRKFSLTPDAFDLVITDMTMPRMTGAELARKILEIKPDMPIILCSGLSESITRDKAEFIGIREILMKPIVMHDMAETVRRVLDGN
ncbi:MAG: response regulator, partial [Desulfobacteraceae bacterium]|nr:response regulator [Desulfobacteraceae bacterium]